MCKSRNYFTLAVLENGQWSAAFGDYDREAVAQERIDTYSGKPARIIKTSPHQADINAAIAAL